MRGYLIPSLSQWGCCLWRRSTVPAQSVIASLQDSVAEQGATQAITFPEGKEIQFQGHFPVPKTDARGEAKRKTGATRRVQLTTRRRPPVRAVRRIGAWNSSSTTPCKWAGRDEQTPSRRVVERSPAGERQHGCGLLARHFESARCRSGTRRPRAVQTDRSRKKGAF